MPREGKATALSPPPGLFLELPSLPADQLQARQGCSLADG